MRIRIVYHEVCVSLDGGITHWDATRICVYAELPSGVDPKLYTIVQDLSEIVIERSKALFTANTLVDTLLETGDPDIDSGLQKAIYQDIELEKTEGYMCDDEKQGAIMNKYSVKIPAFLQVSEGFKAKNRPLKTVECFVLHSNQIATRSVKGKKLSANLVACYLLAWTKEQKEAKMKTPMKSRAQVGRGKNLEVDDTTHLDGDYAAPPDTPESTGNYDDGGGGGGFKRRRV